MNATSPDLDLLTQSFSILIFVLPLFTGAVFGLGFSLYALWRRKTMRAWPAVAGRVIKVEGVQRPVRGFLGRRQYLLDIEIEYIYQWEGVTYQAKLTREAEIDRSDTPLPEEAVGPAMNRLRADVEERDMAVWVNPAKPEQSLMEQVDTRRDVVAVAIFGFLAVVLGGACAWLVL